ncbi:hypothetical protein ABPG75_004727 [Micractinium tetrahymenae]
MIAAIAPCAAPVAIRGTPLAARRSLRSAARPAFRLAPRANFEEKRGSSSSADDRVAQKDSVNPLHWTRTQEVSNGRAAIAGLFFAFLSERLTGFATAEQLFGSSANAPWAKPAFFAVVLLFIAITGTERAATDRQPISGNPQTSPFSPEFRLNAGRAAMVGFAALLVWESVFKTALFG